MAPADPIVREVDIEATPEVVFEFFVDAGKLNRWLTVESTVDPSPGGRCLQSHEAAEGRVFHMEGTFVEVDPPRRVVFTWGFVEPEVGVEPGASVVEVTLEPIGTGTRVHLVHRDLPANEVGNHAGGWTRMLDRLAKAVATEMRPVHRASAWRAEGRD
jgi:uncharacterized protein YndB with AHSA1/START domain